MGNFDHDYAEFDEFGLCRILCQRCGVLIAQRTYIDVPSKLDGTKTIKAAVMARNSSWREVWVRLSNGGNAILKICKDCENEAIDGDVGVKMMKQFRKAWDKENIQNPSPPGEVIKHKEKFKNVVVVGRTPDNEKPPK